MKKIIIFNIAIFLCSISVFAQTYCLGFSVARVSTTQIDVSLSIIGSSPFKLGTSNLVFTFNSNALSLSTTLTNSSLLGSSYQVPTVTLPAAGRASFNTELNTAGTGITVANSYTVGVIRFNILNSALTTNFQTSTLSAIGLDDETNYISQTASCAGLDVALPLDLLDFKANTNGKTNKLSWQTANEVNTQSFDIERSANGKNFEKVGNVKSVGTAKGSYQFTDDVPLSGINYYRLKMMDIDGSFTYSPIRSVVLGKGKTTNVSIAPNPAKGQVFVKLNADDAKAITLVLVDVTGKTVLTERKNLESGFNQLPLNVSNYPQGLYFLKIVDANTTETHRLVIGH